MDIPLGSLDGSRQFCCWAILGKGHQESQTDVANASSGQSKYAEVLGALIPDL